MTGRMVKVFFRLVGFWAVAIIGMTIGGSIILSCSQSGGLNPGKQDLQAAPIKVTAEALAPFATIELNGRGKRVSDPIALPEGLIRVATRYTGRSNVIIELLDDQGRWAGLLANGIGPWDGEKALRIQKAGNYVLDITADGDWQIVIRQ